MLVKQSGSPLPSTCGLLCSASDPLSCCPLGSPVKHPLEPRGQSGKSDANGLMHSPGSLQVKHLGPFSLEYIWRHWLSFRGNLPKNPKNNHVCHQTCEFPATVPSNQVCELQAPFILRDIGLTPGDRCPRGADQPATSNEPSQTPMEI